MLRDNSCDFVQRPVRTVAGGHPAYKGPFSSYSAAAVEPSPMRASTGMTSDADRARIVRDFLEDADDLSFTEGVKSLAEMSAYVRIRYAR